MMRPSSFDAHKCTTGLEPLTWKFLCFGMYGNRYRVLRSSSKCSDQFVVMDVSLDILGTRRGDVVDVCGFIRGSVAFSGDKRDREGATGC